MVYYTAIKNYYKEFNHLKEDLICKIFKCGKQNYINDMTKAKKKKQQTQNIIKKTQV